MYRARNMEDASQILMVSPVTRIAITLFRDQLEELTSICDLSICYPGSFPLLSVVGRDARRLCRVRTLKLK
jgi:hypothetical protein